MTLTITVELDNDQLTALAARAGVSFMKGADMERELQDIIARELSPGVDLGWAYRITYYREDKDEPHGYKLFAHPFISPQWPHVEGRPRLYWDGRAIRTRGGAFYVDATRGIIDLRPKREKRRARAS